MNTNQTLQCRPVVEALEERWLLDGRITLSTLGGPIDTDVLRHQHAPVSIIAMGSAISAALMFGPPGGPGCPGAPGDRVPPDAAMQPDRMLANNALSLVPPELPELDLLALENMVNAAPQLPA